MNGHFEWEIQLTDTRDGNKITFQVKVIIVEGRAASEIRCSRTPDAEQQEAVERIIERLVSHETGRETHCAGSQRCTDVGELHARMRSLLGGGQG